MRTRLLALVLLTAAASLSACGIETTPSDPEALLPPGDRAQPGEGLFTGEKGYLEVLPD